MAPDTPNRRTDDADQYQRTSSTTFFWILVSILAVIGACVLISLILALIYGS